MKTMRISKGSASKVWQDFIESGGQGSKNGWLTRGDKVLVTETRRCRQRGGGVPEDLRVLQPRMEVVAVVLYTGTLLASDSSECVLR
jgi:hypothetical protein